MVAFAFAPLLLFTKNAPATPPKIATMTTIKIVVSLILVPSIGVPEPYAPPARADQS